MGQLISSMMKKRQARHLSQYESMQLISTKLETKMHLDGFDYMRAIWHTTIILLETMLSLKGDIKTKIFGSVGEGIFYPVNDAYEKDIDTALIPQTVVAVENDHEVIHDSELVIYVIENDQYFPGYCYLCLKTDDRKVYLDGSKLKSSLQNIMADSISQINENLQDMIYFTHLEPPGQQGPAINFRVKTEGVGGLCKRDTVVLIRCPKWPTCASKWITRRRAYQWPTEKIIAEIVAKGVYLAPVGCKIHPRRDQQWRYSFNEAERQLVRSFKTTQAKCYALLKRVIAEHVRPYFDGEDVISSYHLKTILFWMIEETDPQVWIPSNLIACVFLVLNRLRQCVDCRKCPNYFMPEENLFPLKVTLANNEEVLTCISSFMEVGWQAILSLSNFAFDQDFTGCIHQEYDMDTSFEMLFARITLEGMSNLLLPKYIGFLDVFENQESDRIRSRFTDITKHLICHANDCGDDKAKEVLYNIIAKVCSSYGTMCLSYSRCPTVESSKRAEMDELGYKYIQLSCLRQRVECLAKYANCEYVHGNFQSVLFIADSIIPMYCNRLSVAYIFSIRISFHLQMKQFLDQCVANDSELYDIIENLLCQREIIFTKNEIYAIPDNAKIEMSIDKETLGELGIETGIKQYFVVDPYFYVTYLSFLTYSELGNQVGEDKAIQFMEVMCSVHPYCYQPISLNLLGDCYLKRGKVHKALQKFAISMQRNKKRNAAPWHVARLVWRKLNDRWLQTHVVDY